MAQAIISHRRSRYFTIRVLGNRQQSEAEGFFGAKPVEKFTKLCYNDLDKSEFVGVVMHKIFGQKEDIKYLDRKGAYIIPINGEEVGIVETPKGFFFLGGGINVGETEIECIIRECMEEAGYQVKIKEKVCSAETYYLHPTIGFFHPILLFGRINFEDERTHRDRPLV